MGVAQLVRAPGCGPGGRGFESHHSPLNYMSQSHIANENRLDGDGFFVGLFTSEIGHRVQDLRFDLLP